VWAGGAQEIARELQTTLPLVDVAVGTEEEIAAAAGLAGEAALARVRALCPGLVVMKQGPRGATAFAQGEMPVHVPGFPVTVLNTLGAGDGFMSGFLSGWLRGDPVARCLRTANAVGAIVVTRHGCSPAMPTQDEVRAFIAEKEGS
jgi:5-dehydro-2-deoxygluconokinase